MNANPIDRWWPFLHNGKQWMIVQYKGSFFARFDGSDTGPFSTRHEAENWIKEILAA